MTQKLTEQMIDVRPMPPRQRHPTIFNTWNNMEAGGAILLVNDHDPVPLYYQFACEYQGGFRWEYLDAGPEIWRVRISKGDYPDPGFVPTRKPVTPAPAPAPIEFVKPLVLDVRPIFASGQTPCQAIDDAVASLIPGQTFVLLVPFEPVPLYAKLRHRGLEPQAKQVADGTWRIEFRGAADAPAPGGESVSCGCSH